VVEAARHVQRHDRDDAPRQRDVQGAKALPRHGEEPVAEHHLDGQQQHQDQTDAVHPRRQARPPTDEVRVRVAGVLGDGEEDRAAAHRSAHEQRDERYIRADRLRRASESHRQPPTSHTCGDVIIPAARRGFTTP